MSKETNYNRRQFIGSVAMSIAATQVGGITSVEANSSENNLPEKNSESGASASFAPIKQIDAGLLNVGYAEAGPANGHPVLILHGWPYDIYSFVDVAPLLAAAGH